MVDTRVNPKLKVFVEHGEKIALGVAALLLVGYLVSSSFFAKDDTLSKDLRSWAAKIDDEVKESHKGLSPEKGADITRIALAPYNAQPPSVATDAWIMAYPTRADITVKGKAVEPEKAHLLPDVSITRAQTALGVVTIVFGVSTIDPDKAVPAPIVRFIVERKDKTGAWKALSTTVAANKEEFADETVDPSTPYTYRVIAVTDDPKTKNATKMMGRPSNELAVTSADIWKLWVVMVIPDLDEDGKGKVSIKVQKYEKSAGKMYEYTREYKENDPEPERRIGFDRDGKSTKDQVGPGGKVTVDFNCGWVLESIREDSKRSKPGKKCHEIILVSATDKKKKLKINTLDDMEIKAPAPPDPKKREDDAAKLIAEADKLWESEKEADKKAAVKKYEQVKKDYADTEAVKKALAVIDERIAAAPK